MVEEELFTEEECKTIYSVLNSLSVLNDILIMEERLRWFESRKDQLEFRDNIIKLEEKLKLIFRSRGCYLIEKEGLDKLFVEPEIKTKRGSSHLIS